MENVGNSKNIFHFSTSKIDHFPALWKFSRIATIDFSILIHAEHICKNNFPIDFPDPAKQLVEHCEKRTFGRKILWENFFFYRKIWKSVKSNRFLMGTLADVAAILARSEQLL